MYSSVLGPLLFLIYINDITVYLHSSVVCYADDTTLLEVVSSSDVSAIKLNEDLSKIADWSNKWIVEMNSSKTKSVVFSAKRDKPFRPPLFLNNTAIEDVDHISLYKSLIRPVMNTVTSFGITAMNLRAVSLKVFSTNLLGLLRVLRRGKVVRKC